MNRNYNRSRSREYQLFHDLEKQGYLAVRSAGSHGIADVLGIKPAQGCCNPAHFEVKFIQIKVSEGLKNKHVDVKAQDAPFGLVNVEFWKFPVIKRKHDSKTKKTRMDKQQLKSRLRKGTNK